MEQKIIFKTYLYSRKKIICIWLRAGLLFGGIISLIPYLIVGGDFRWAALLIPIGVTVITSPFIYNKYKKFHYWKLMRNVKENRKPASERSKTSQMVAEWTRCVKLLDAGLITQEECEAKEKVIFGLE